LRASTSEELASTSFPFEDSRLQEMLFRYRARNYSDSLSADEVARWEEYRFGYLTDPDMGATICMEAYHEEIESLLLAGDLTTSQRELMQQLLDYSDSLLG
jgi:exodeoxyribonuclease-1